MFTENVRAALAALSSNRLRTALTLLGVAIGVFAVTATVSLGDMATASVRQEISAGNMQTIDVYLSADTPGAEPFSESDLLAAERLSLKVLRKQSTAATLKSDRATLELNLNGVGVSATDLGPAPSLQAGRYLGAADEVRSAAVMVLSQEAAQKLYGSEPPVGQTLWLLGQGVRSRYTVVGVKAPAAGLLAANDASADIPLSSFNRDVTSVVPGEYQNFQVGVPLEADASLYETQLQEMFTRRRNSGVEIISSANDLNMLGNVTQILQLVLGGIGSISLLVGGIGIVNIMLVSVTERTREIGLRKALGATPALIKQQFLIEAVILSALGGAAGLLLAVLALYGVSAAVPYLQTVVLSPFTLALAFGVSLITGVLCGVWPAAKAAKLSAVEALRHE